MRALTNIIGTVPCEAQIGVIPSNVHFARLRIVGRNDAPALMLDVHRSTFKDYVTFYAQIKTSHGVWGTRHQWLQGFLTIIELMLEIDEYKRRWEKNEAFIENLKATIESIKRVETVVLKLSEMR